MCFLKVVHVIPLKHMFAETRVEETFARGLIGSDVVQWRTRQY